MFCLGVLVLLGGGGGGEMVKYGGDIMYANGKMRPVETIPGMEGGEGKENGGGGEFKYDIL
jgi:hypothetical protein